MYMCKCMCICMYVRTDMIILITRSKMLLMNPLSLKAYSPPHNFMIRIVHVNLHVLKLW